MGATGIVARFDPQNPRVEDRLAIFDLFTEYCAAVDTRDKARFRGVFTPDAILDYSANVLIGKGSVAEMEPQIIDLMAMYSATVHQWSNAEIEFTGPNTARARVMLDNPMYIKFLPVFPFFTIHAYYNYDLVKSEKDGKWRSKHLHMEIPVGAYGQILAWVLIIGIVFKLLRTR